MSEFVELGASQRKMVLEIYGKDLHCAVSEPTTSQLIEVENKMTRVKAKDRHKLVKQVGLGHLVSIRGLGRRNEKGKLVELVTEPDRPGYDPDWMKKLKKESVGLKIAALIVNALYTVGGKKAEEDDEEFGDDSLDFDDDGLDDEVQEPGERQPAAGGEQKKSGGK